MTALQVVGVQPNRVSLNLSEGLGFNEWRAIGEKLVRMQDSSQWWVGDWLAYGDRYRRDYTTAMEQLDHSFHALRNYAYVSSRVESALRSADLSWSHHRLVAPLEPDQQRYWLDEALRHGWTVRDLEQSIAEQRSSGARPPALALRAVGELYELCVRAAARAGVEPAAWATAALEQAARLELEAEATSRR